MKKNKGFFLAETIIVLALVTTAIAFVLPNVTKVYENYKNVSKYYDQPQDIYVLQAISKLSKLTHEESSGFLGLEKIVVTDRSSFEEAVGDKTSGWCDNNVDSLEEIYDGSSGQIIDASTQNLLKFKNLYIVSYLSTPNIGSNDYEFQKYLNRLKKSSYDNTSYRLIGIFEKIIDGKTVRTYASIKIPNPKAGTSSCP